MLSFSVFFFFFFFQAEDGIRDVDVTGVQTCALPISPDSDRIIIAAYEGFANLPGRKVVLFSSDNEFVVQSSGGSNLIAQLVRYPSEMSDHYQTKIGRASCRERV